MQRSLPPEITSDVEDVSPKKPMGYLERGIRNGEFVRPAFIGDVPAGLLSKLVANKDVCIIAKAELVNGGAVLSPPEDIKKIIENDKKDKNNRKIFLVNKEDKSVNLFHVFHLPSLKELLTKNEELALSWINSKRALTEKKENFTEINDEAVFTFVKLTGKANAEGEARALVNAAFADRSFFTYPGHQNIKLTDTLQTVFGINQKQKSNLQAKSFLSHSNEKKENQSLTIYHSLTKTDWENIKIQYTKHRLNIFTNPSQESNIIYQAIIKATKNPSVIELENLATQVAVYMEKHPNKKLAQIINNQTTPKVTIDAPGRKFGK